MKRRRGVTVLKEYPAYKPAGVEWLGEIPVHWVVERLKSSVSNVVKPATKRRATTTFVALEHVESWTGRVKTDDWNEPLDSQLKCFCQGDVLFGKLRPYLAKVTRLKRAGVCVGEFLVLRPCRPDFSASYLEYLLRSQPIIERVNSSTFGAKMPRANWQFMGSMMVVRPPVREQTAIVRYLDHADEHIRPHIRSKQKLIKLMEEQKKTIIHRALTGQTDTRTGQPYPAYKPSGVECLGEVPANWEVCTLGRIATSFRTGPFGSMLHQSDYVEDGTPVINPVHMNNGAIVEDPRCSVPDTVAERLSNYRLGLHDLVFSRRGELGRCVMVRNREVGWLCGTGSIRVRIRYKGIVPKFLIQALQVRWIGEYLSLFSVGATMDNLNTGILKGVPLLVPPIQQQMDIVEYIGKRTAKIDYAIGRSEKRICLLREYRTRLIADVVTGKVDVREAAVQLPDETDDQRQECEVMA